MNKVICKVKDCTTFFKFKYVYYDTQYAIEVPKTENNDFLKDGDIIEVEISIVLNEEQLKRIEK